MQNVGKEEISPTILLVDDNVELLEMLSELLAMHGYATLQAQNGQFALDILREAPRFPILIVLDMSMPVLNGHEFLAAKARDAILRDIPVVVVSGSEASETPLPDIKAYLRKPVVIDQLISLIDDTIETFPKS